MNIVNNGIVRSLVHAMLIPVVLIMMVGFTNEKEVEELMYAEPIVVTQPAPTLQGDLYVFLDAVAHRESNNKSYAVNRIGMLGKYQFSPKTLWQLGAQFKVTRQEFLDRGELQDSAMVQYLKDNRKILRDIIVEYEGKWYEGIYITESGLLAGAHLVGPHGLRAYFDSDYTVKRGDRSIRPRTVDGNGTTVAEYIEKFSGYDLEALDIGT